MSSDFNGPFSCMYKYASHLPMYGCSRRSRGPLLPLSISGATDHTNIPFSSCHRKDQRREFLLLLVAATSASTPGCSSSSPVTSHWTRENKKGLAFNSAAPKTRSYKSSQNDARSTYIMFYIQYSMYFYSKAWFVKKVHVFAKSLLFFSPPLSLSSPLDHDGRRRGRRRA